MDGLMNQPKEAWKNSGERTWSSQIQGHLEPGKSKLELGGGPPQKELPRSKGATVLCPNQQDLPRQHV